jgi:hypothetical protein
VVDFVLQNHHHDGLITSMVGHNDHQPLQNEFIQHSMHYHNPDYVHVSLENDDVTPNQLQHQIYEQHEVYPAQDYDSRHNNYYPS